jgi:hypothetical protein
MSPATTKGQLILGVGIRVLSDIHDLLPSIAKLVMRGRHSVLAGHLHSAPLGLPLRQPTVQRPPRLLHEVSHSPSGPGALPASPTPTAGRCSTILTTASGALLRHILLLLLLVQLCQRKHHQVLLPFLLFLRKHYNYLRMRGSSRGLRLLPSSVASTTSKVNEFLAYYLHPLSTIIGPIV